MAINNYPQRLSNLQNRKFDRELNESVLSKQFSATDIPTNIKYLLESMRPIEKKYNDKTVEAANRIQKHLETGFKLQFNRAYRTQGSVMTRTNIKVHSDFDLLTIIDSYYYPQTSTGDNYDKSNPDDDIITLRKQSVEILKGIYDEVDDSGEKSISIFNKALNRKVDIVFCFWFYSDKYQETKNEYYRGVYLYKFPSRQKLKDFPFATIDQVNSKGENTKDGSRKAIRLLKNLKADADPKLSLSSFQLTSLVHGIDNMELTYSYGDEIKIAEAVSKQLDKVIKDTAYRKSIKGPNGLENPLENDSCVTQLTKLKGDLDSLIYDCNNELSRIPSIKRAILSY